MRELTRQFLDDCRAAGWRVATAESCTGGLIAATLTAIGGSSDVVDRGFITYSNAAKHDLLGVPDALLESHGAVSEQVARAMALGARQRARVDLALAVTGIAGPGGATPLKPVGLVHMAAAGPGDHVIHRVETFTGDRDDVRGGAMLRALTLGWRMLGREA